MRKAWNYYLLAFNNIFNYGDIAQRADLNWYLLFMFSFWILFGMFTMFIVITFIVLKMEDTLPAILNIILVLGCLYLMAHALPLVSLIKRRFNYLLPAKSVVCFSTFIIAWLIQASCAIGMFFYITNHAESNMNPLLLIPFGLLSQLGGLLVLGTVIFLAIRQKPFA